MFKLEFHHEHELRCFKLKADSNIIEWKDKYRSHKLDKFLRTFAFQMLQKI